EENNGNRAAIDTDRAVNKAPEERLSQNSNTFAEPASNKGRCPNKSRPTITCSFCFHLLWKIGWLRITPLVFSGSLSANWICEPWVLKTRICVLSVAEHLALWLSASHPFDS